MNELTTIENQLRSATATPHELAEMKVKLAGWFSHFSTELEEIYARRPMKWNELRKDTKSDKSADRAYEATEDGIRLMRLKMTLERIEKCISAISSILRVKENEARNNF